MPMQLQHVQRHRADDPIQRRIVGIDDGNLCCDANPPDRRVYVSCRPGLTVVCAREVGLDHPSTLEQRFLDEAGGRTVYLHAMVRDEKGLKMSKTKGNVIDPLEVVEEVGADALRFTLDTMAAQVGESFTLVREGTPADFVVVNTCSITKDADSAARQAIRRAAREHPTARIVVTGCYAEVAPEALRGLPGVAAVVGIRQQTAIGALLEELARGTDPGRPAVVPPAPAWGPAAICTCPATCSRSRSRSWRPSRTRRRSASACATSPASGASTRGRTRSTRPAGASRRR